MSDSRVSLLFSSVIVCFLYLKQMTGSQTDRREIDRYALRTCG